VSGRVKEFVGKINFMPKRRIFIAIQIPEELKNAAEIYIKSFFNDKNVRISKREGWHITVVFCGYLNENELEKLKEIVGNIASKTKPFEIFPDKILFYPLKRPRMVWLAFKASRQFAQLKKEIENAIMTLQKDGLFKQFKVDYPANPHMTIVKFEQNYFNSIKKFLPTERIDLAAEAAPFSVKNVDIMESHLNRSSAEYERLTKYIIGV